MGNRPTTAALSKAFYPGSQAVERVQNGVSLLIVNAAADIDAGTYSRRMQPVMAALGPNAR